MDFSKILTDFRKSSGKSQKDFAEELGVPQTTWAGYELGKTEPKLGTLIALAERGYIIPSLSNGFIVGNNNTQTIGNNNRITALSDEDGSYAELFELLRNYGTPKMLKDLKEKLLKVKEASED